MNKVTLGRTELTVNKNGFGALPIQRIGKDAAVKLLRRAFDNGINYYDTAHMYSDSEEKLGEAFSSVRSQIVLSTKTMAQTVEGFWSELEESLRRLQTDYIDIYQLHNPAVCPKPGDGSGFYEALLEARRQGKIRYIGLTNHRLAVAKDCLESDLYDTLQFPFSYLSGEEERVIVERCREQNIGFIAMKGLAGGLINDSALAYAFMSRFEGVAPIWGIQKEEELSEFLSYQDNPPTLTPERLEKIEKDRQELAGAFCRGCGYCMPCPVGIEISGCARMSLMLRRSNPEGYLTEHWQAEMKKIPNCLHCDSCKSKCPYGLDTPALLEKNYNDYLSFL